MLKKIFAFMASIGLSFAASKLPESKPLVVILLGPPGAGKGTHAVNLSKKLSLPHISTGDLFRENLSKKTELGLKVKTLLNQGHLAPDEVVLEMLFDRVSKEDCKKGYILDGFPRTINQAKALEEKLKGKANIVIVNLEIADNEVIDRITGRIVCRNCGAPFHKTYLPPQKEGVCDHCLGELYQRKDDNIDVVKERLSVYHKQTKPLISFYKEKHADLANVNAAAPKDTVFKNLVQSITK